MLTNIAKNCRRFLTIALASVVLSFSFNNPTQAQTTASAVTLVGGWNLLGNGTTAPIDVFSKLNDANSVLTVWKWNAATSTWAFYTPVQADGGAAYAASKGYEPLTTIYPGEGYWVNAKTSFSLPASLATSYSYSNLLSTSATAMLSGWNLLSIGDVISPSVFNLNLSLTPPNTGIIPENLTTLWAWDPVSENQNPGWYFYSPALDGKGTLQSYIASKGYKDFTVKAFKLQDGVGFWVNNPTQGLTAVRGLLRNLNSGNKVTVANGLTRQDLLFNGLFSFTVPFSTNYNITIGAQPTGQTCQVTNPSGVSGAGGAATVVTDILIDCTTTTKAQTITFAQPSAMTVGTTAVLSASASSGLTVSFSSSTTAICTVSGSTLTAVAAGTCSITASQGGNGTYAAATAVTKTVTVSNPAPVITFTAPTPLTVGQSQTLSAVSSSGLAVTFTASPATVCTVSGNVLSAVGIGTCSIVASQAASGSFAAATETRTVSVTSSGYTYGLLFFWYAYSGSTPVLYQAWNNTNTPYMYTAENYASWSSNVNNTSSSNNINIQGCSSITAPNPSVGSTININAGCAFTTSARVDVVGMETPWGSIQVLYKCLQNQCSVIKSWDSTNTATPTATINSPSQTISFSQPQTQAAGTTLALSATASSGLSVSYSTSTSSVCTLSGSTVSFIAGGTCTVTASQAGNSSYAAAANVTVSITVNPTTYNLDTQFSSSSNPSGQWSYGETNGWGGAFTAFSAKSQYSLSNGATVVTWLGANLVSGTPAISHNPSTTAGCSVQFPALCLTGSGTIFHPGVGTRVTTIRFTVPSSGTYSIAGSFWGADNGTHNGTSVGMLINGVLSGSKISITTPDVKALTPQNITLTRAFIKGDLIDFTVDSNGDIPNDSTGIKVIIQGPVN